MMKGSQKKWQPNSTESVIGMLMGFDAQPPQQLVPDKRRTLSERYLHNVASISLRPESSVSIGRSRSTNNGVKDVSRVRSSNVLDKCVNSSSSNARSGVRSLEPSTSSASVKKTEHCAARRVLRHHQKLEHDSLVGHVGEIGFDFVNNSIKFPLDMKDKPHSSVACTRSVSQISPPERRRSKFEHVLKAEHKDYGQNPHLLVDQSSLANKSRKKIIERRKKAERVQDFGVTGMVRNLDVRLCTNDFCRPSSLQSRSSGSSSPPVFSNPEVQTSLQKDILESKSGRTSLQLQTSLDVDNTISPSSKVSELPRRDVFSSGSSYNNSDAYIQGIPNEIDNCFENDDRCKEIESISRNPKSSISNLAAQYIHDASYDSEEAVNAEDFTRINGDPLSKSYPVILLEEGVHSSNVEEVVSREASLNELSEEDSAYFKCSGICPLVSLENLKKTSQQHSPDSVLESHDTNNPRPFECFDSLGLMLQLQALKFELEESLSDGSAIKESGDEDFELFGDLSHDGRKIKRWLGDEESKNFSYLVDVLDEAGFYDSNSFMDFNKWASLECSISPLVFDALEKKYGKQTSWQKYERLLLFDRINSGLLDIYYPFINFHDGVISIRKKLCASFRRDEVEEELWTMLISQENEKSKDLSEKALDKWWEFKEGVSIICGELEASLLDELVMELASSYD